MLLAVSSYMRAQLGDQYKVGHAYYELTKSEKVQPSKDMVIQNKDTGKMYGGRDARRMLNLPLDEYIRVRPGDHSKFRIFVKSTSINRKLVGNTKLLYKKN